MALPDDSQTTPCAARKANSMETSLGGMTLPQYRIRVTHDMNGHFVKTDSVVEFLDAFLPYPSTAPKRRKRRKNPFETLENADKLVEAEVVLLFRKAVTSKNLCPNLVFVTSEHTPDPKGVDKTQQKVDAGFFHPNDAPTNGQPCWPLDVVPVEFKNRKKGDIYDPLNDKAKDAAGFESQADTRKDVRGQLTTYSELAHQLQHRIFLLMLLVIGRRYRLMRWDRAGTVVTPSVDYYKDPDGLCEFLWRISHLDDEALGLDPTAVRLQGAAFDELDTIARPVRTDVDHTPRFLKERELISKFCFQYVREMFAASIQDRALPRYKLHISTGDKAHTFLVGKPVSVARGMVGRGTRGWVAWHCEGACFVWLKDAWRVSFEGIEREGDILGRLNRAKISGVPTLVCHGDVGNQTTVTADWWKRKNRPGRTTPSAAPAPTPDESASTSSNNAGDSSRKRKRPLEDECSADSAQPSARRGPRRACRGVESPEDKSLVRKKRPSAPAVPVEPALGETPAGPVVYSQECHIKHHTHYRMVVAEVGMPLKEFMSGQQLASILLDCILAHHGAATSKSLKVRVLHRDVSDQNILIYPKIVKSKNGARTLVWGGILTDWEISKPIPKFDGEERARQPERTGRWQFMSANLLMNPLQRVMIEDELESFFHILIYYAVRYLESNLATDEHAAHFLEACFDCFTLDDNKVICGYQKLTLVKNGKSPKIVFHHPKYTAKRPIKFRSKGLNDIVTAMIPCLRARYKILAWKWWLEDLPKDSPAHPQCKGRYETPPPQTSSNVEDGVRGATSTRNTDDTEPADGPQEEMAPSPTKGDWEAAMRIASHTFIETELRSAIDSELWHGNDRIPDRVPSDYVCHFKLMSSIPESKTSPAVSSE